MSAKVVVISGTPGVGKTSVALRLSEILNGRYLNLSEFVIDNKLYTYYDGETDSYVIDEEKLKTFLRGVIRSSEGYIVVDSHYGEIIDDELIFKIVILRLDPRVLYMRLVGKGWSGRKLLDNIESELIGVCTYNALNEHGRGKVCEVDITNKDLNDVINEVLGLINNTISCNVGINWLECEEVVREVLSITSYLNRS